MPLDTLAQPTLSKSIAHLERNYLMLCLHEEVKNRQGLLLDSTIERVSLHNKLSALPLLSLAL
jgi:hypothetical protein